MGEMSHASKVCPLTALLTECIRQGVALMIRARSLEIYPAMEIHSKIGNQQLEHLISREGCG